MPTKYAIRNTTQACLSSVPPPGYPAFAAFQSRATDSMIFRRFRTLNSLNLLYLQTEMFALEADLQERWARDLESDNIEQMRGYKSYEALQQQAQQHVNDKPADPELRSLLSRLRTVTKEYNDAILQYNQILTLEPPRKRPLEALKTWLNTFEWPLIDSGSRYLSPGNETQIEELMALGADGQKRDFITNMIYDKAARFLNSDPNLEVNEDVEDPHAITQIYFFSARHANVLVMAVKLVMAMILLFGAIVWLYFTESNGVRLGLVGGFTGLFCLTLLATTTASRGEMFGATAAYAAVLVVFISSDISSH